MTKVCGKVKCGVEYQVMYGCYLSRAKKTKQMKGIALGIVVVALSPVALLDVVYGPSVCKIYRKEKCSTDRQLLSLSYY